MRSLPRQASVDWLPPTKQLACQSVRNRGSAWVPLVNTKSPTGPCVNFSDALVQENERLTPLS